MADVHNGIKYATGELQALALLAGVSRDQAGVERLGETLTPIIDLWRIPEAQWLRNTQYWAGRVSQAAVAAEGSMAAITNPASSNQLVVIEDITAADGTSAGNVILGLATEAQLTATLAFGFASARDTRMASKNPGPATAYNNVNVGLGNGSDPTLSFNSVLDEIRTAVIEMAEFKSPPWVLAPGTGLWIQAGTVNHILFADFSGYVRQALPGELRS